MVLLWVANLIGIAFLVFVQEKVQAVKFEVAPHGIEIT